MAFLTSADRQVLDCLRQSRVYSTPSISISKTGQDLVAQIVKNTNFNYRQAKDAAQRDRLTFRRNRALRKLRPNYSADRYYQLTLAVSRMEFHELMHWLDEVEATWT